MRLTDTSPEVEKIQIELFRRMSSEKRLQAGIELSHTSRKLLTEGVRHRHPEYTEDEIRLATIKLLLSQELFEMVYPEAGAIEP